MFRSPRSEYKAVGAEKVVPKQATLAVPTEKVVPKQTTSAVPTQVKRNSLIAQNTMHSKNDSLLSKDDFNITEYLDLPNMPNHQNTLSKQFFDAVPQQNPVIVSKESAYRKQRPLSAESTRNQHVDSSQNHFKAPNIEIASSNLVGTENATVKDLLAPLADQMLSQYKRASAAMADEYLPPDFQPDKRSSSLPSAYSNINDDHTFVHDVHPTQPRSKPNGNVARNGFGQDNNDYSDQPQALLPRASLRLPYSHNQEEHESAKETYNQNGTTFKQPKFHNIPDVKVNSINDNPDVTRYSISDYFRKYPLSQQDNYIEEEEQTSEAEDETLSQHTIADSENVSENPNPMPRRKNNSHTDGSFDENNGVQSNADETRHANYARQSNHGRSSHFEGGASSHFDNGSSSYLDPGKSSQFDQSKSTILNLNGLIQYDHDRLSHTDLDRLSHLDRVNSSHIDNAGHNGTQVFPAHRSQNHYENDGQNEFRTQRSIIDPSSHQHHQSYRVANINANDEPFNSHHRQSSYNYDAESNRNDREGRRQNYTLNSSLSSLTDIGSDAPTLTSFTSDLHVSDDVFRQNLANLDANIARLQNALQSRLPH